MLFELKEIDRALEWAVRDAAVKAGYWPDVRGLIKAGTYSDAVLNAACAAIAAQHRPLVEVFGPGGWKERREIKGNYVIITRGPTGSGSYATGAPVEEEPDPEVPGTFRLVQRPDEPQQIQYDVRFVSDNTANDRLLTQLLLAVFPKRRYLPGMRDDLTGTAEKFWVITGQGSDLSTGDMLERRWPLTVLDVQLVPDLVLETGIVPAVDVQVQVQVRRAGEAAGEQAQVQAVPG